VLHYMCDNKCATQSRQKWPRYAIKCAALSYYMHVILVEVNVQRHVCKCYVCNVKCATQSSQKWPMYVIKCAQPCARDMS